jgi:hypothetical protein
MNGSRRMQLNINVVNDSSIKYNLFSIKNNNISILDQFLVFARWFIL